MLGNPSYAEIVEFMKEDDNIKYGLGLHILIGTTSLSCSIFILPEQLGITLPELTEEQELNQIFIESIDITEEN